MGDMLSQDEINALLSGMSTGEPQAESTDEVSADVSAAGEELSIPES